MKKSRRREGACIFVHELLDHKVRKSLFIICDAIESMSIKYATEKLEIRYLKDLRNLKESYFVLHKNRRKYNQHFKLPYFQLNLHFGT